MGVAMASLPLIFPGAFATDHEGPIEGQGAEIGQHVFNFNLGPWPDRRKNGSTSGPITISRAAEGIIRSGILGFRGAASGVPSPQEPKQQPKTKNTF